MFFTRGKGETAHLEWRLRIFGIGGGLGVGGVWLDNSWMVYAAILTLFVGVALRFARDGDSDEVESAESSDESFPPDDGDTVSR